MLSDMVGRGAFHRHIMTSGGRIARPARAAQSDSNRKLPAIPAVQTAETQTAVTVALMELSCILKVYRPALYGAVPECTCKPRSNPTEPFGPNWVPKSRRLAASLCDREQRTAALFATVVGMAVWRLSRTICC